MTRINLIDPAVLCDQQLIAEWRELTRIPNAVRAGLFRSYKKLGGLRAPDRGSRDAFIKKLAATMPKDPCAYTVRLDAEPDAGKGHVVFFYYRLHWLYARYSAVYAECRLRKLAVSWQWPTYGDGRCKDLPLAVEELLAEAAMLLQLPPELNARWVPTAAEVARSNQRVNETRVRMKRTPVWSSRK